MDKIDLTILNILIEHKANSFLRAITRKEIVELVEIGPQNLFLRLHGLMSSGCIEKGIQDGKEHTYYITKNGIEKLAEVLNDEK